MSNYTGRARTVKTDRGGALPVFVRSAEPFQDRCVYLFVRTEEPMKITEENVMDSSPEFRQEPAQEPRVVVPPPPAGWRRRDYYPEDSRTKSPALATLMSLVPGLGQVYIGYYQQGFVNILTVASLITLLAQGLGAAAPLAGIFLAFFWLYNLVDAARKATMYNQALAGLGPLELPTHMEKPDRKGSLYAGILMMVFGIVVLAHTRFGLPLEWLERWWPSVLVIVGAYLVVRSVMDQRQKVKT
jgi:hypothetical protein